MLLYKKQVVTVKAFTSDFIVIATDEQVYCGIDDIQPIILNDFLLSQLFSGNANIGWYFYTNALYKLEHQNNGYGIVMDFCGNSLHTTPKSIISFHELENTVFFMFDLALDKARKKMSRTIELAFNMDKY